MSTTETTAIFTTVKTTTKTTSFSIINTTIPTTVSKAVITNSTTVNTIPRLQFVDKDPPIKNVTGIKKIWPQKPYMNLNNQTTKFYKKPINVTNVQTTLNMSTLYQKSTTKATPISRNFSKAYIHYGKNEDGKNIVVTTEKSIFKITPNKLENIITFNQGL